VRPAPIVDDMVRSAVISECGRYRYELIRTWDAQLPVLEVQMLNPSKADGSVDDPTIGRLVGTGKRPGFARRWGYGSIRVTNRFALRATNPAALLADPDPFGPLNDNYLSRPVGSMTLVAWGSHKALAALAHDWPDPINPICLGVNADGSPKHPLYVRADTPFQPYRIAARPY